MQTVEAMKITNFSFKDIGVFHNDEKLVKTALRDYFTSGAMSTFGRHMCFSEVITDRTETGTGNGSGSGDVKDGHKGALKFGDSKGLSKGISLHAEGTEKMVYR